MLTQATSVIQRIDAAMGSVRRIATELRPSVLDQLGLPAALEWQGQEFGSRTGIDVTMEICAGRQPIPDDLASSAFRVLQESLTNVARHAKARRVSIRLNQFPGWLTLQVADDGVGIPPERLQGTSSLGLVGMRERALAGGGALNISGEPGGGTTVLLRFPLPSEKTA
jgi:signal transduction histidine kinase